MEICLKPPYVPLIQKPSCCAVTCLQMILYRNGFGLHDQEELALEFGVKIDPKNAFAFRDSMPTSTVVADWGISTVESQDRINAVLAARAPSLTATCVKKSALPPLREFLKKHLEANHDLWIEYHSDEIHAYDAETHDHIHDNLIESLDLERGEATFVDPWGWHKQRFPVALDMIERAISDTFGQETGIVVVEKRG